MTAPRDEHAIDTLPRLEALLGPCSDASLQKEVPYVHPAYRAMIEAAPFAVLATTGPGGLDASPRGGPPGFVQVADERTLLIPDATGNNRLDTLENLVADPRIGVLFLVPGVDEVLRVNGTARLRDEAAFTQRFAAPGATRLPALVIEVQVQEAYLHCPKALMRAQVWNPTARVATGTFPGMNAMLKSQLGSAIVTETDEEAAARYRTQLAAEGL